MNDELLRAMCAVFWSETRLPIGDKRRMALVIPVVARYLRSLGYDDAAQALEKDQQGHQSPVPASMS